jgi:hypothetical protein
VCHLTDERVVFQLALSVLMLERCLGLLQLRHELLLLATLARCDPISLDELPLVVLLRCLVLDLLDGLARFLGCPWSGSVMSLAAVRRERTSVVQIGEYSLRSGNERILLCFEWLCTLLPVSGKTRTEQVRKIIH